MTPTTRWVTALAFTLASWGCASQLDLLATPGRPAASTAVLAALSPGAAGTTVTIADPSGLPDVVRNAHQIRAVIGGKSNSVTRTDAGALTFTVPATTTVTPDVNGNLYVVFIADDVDSQGVNLATGSPVQFDTPAVSTSTATIAQGLHVQLTAHTSASPDQYTLDWAASTSAQGPWQAISGDGKQVDFNPGAPGSYYIKVDVVNKATQQVSSAITPSAVVFVKDDASVLSSTPASGFIDRGQPVTLAFNRPVGLAGSDLVYNWSTASTAQGPWTPLDGHGATTAWLPTEVGSYFVRAQAADPTSGLVDTFVSPNALVFVQENQPLVTASSSSVQRGDRVTLTLGIPNVGPGPFNWYYQVSSGAAAPAGSWTAMTGAGTGAQVAFLVNDAGAYNFRVDFPDAGGTIRSFDTTNPVLNVHEGATPLITSDPPNEVLAPGGSVSLVLNARGVDDTHYKYTWYYATNPSFGWTAMPVTPSNNLHLTRFTWATAQSINTGFGNTTTSVTAAGAYFIRVDATPLDTPTTTYTFTSAVPVVTIEP